MSFAEQVEVREGYVWPKVDRAGAFPVTLKELPSVELYSRIARHRRVVVQAGGNCGMFPKAYAGLFETVYTFEPDPLNFFCLAQNASSANVVKFQAGLGVDRRLLKIVPLFADNIAGYGVAPGGYIPTMRIDDLGLNACDLIQLDVEGSEFAALLGARETITRYRPVIALELKGVGLRVDLAASDNTIRAFLTSLGYKVQRRVFNDDVFVPVEYD